MKKKLELVPGLKWKPFFKTDAELRKWQEEWTEKIREELDEQRRRQIESQLNARDYFIG